jgi:hypothetical protein
MSPFAGDQTAVPAQQRRRRHEEAAPRRARQKPRQRGQHDPIRIVEIGPVHLTTQHGDLVPKHDDLEVLGTVTTPEQHQELEDPTQDEVERGPEHKQPGCPQPEHARATNPQVQDISPVSAPHKLMPTRIMRGSWPGSPA